MNIEIKEKIEREAIKEAALSFHPIHSKDQNTACQINYRVGAEKYAELWQAAEAKAERYEKALFEIQFKATAGIFPHLPVETMGAQMCIEIEKIATEAINPKTSTDANRTTN